MSNLSLKQYFRNSASSLVAHFDLYSIGVDGKDLERITFFNGFDGFPMFSPDGRYIVFASNRNQAKRGDTNLFIAEWNYR